MRFCESGPEHAHDFHSKASTAMADKDLRSPPGWFSLADELSQAYDVISSPRASLASLLKRTMLETPSQTQNLPPLYIGYARSSIPSAGRFAEVPVSSPSFAPSSPGVRCPKAIQIFSSSLDLLRGDARSRYIVSTHVGGVTRLEDAAKGVGDDGQSVRN